MTYGEPAVNLADQVLYVGGTNDNSILIAGGGAGSETKWSNPNPTTATDIAGIPAGTTFDIGATAISILERILYPYIPVSFTSFNSQLNTSYELGQTASGTETITWGTTGPTGNWIVNSGEISYSGFTSGSLTSGFNLYSYDGTPFSESITVTYPSIRATQISNNTLTVSITGQQSKDTPLVSTTDTSRWWSRLYWGKSTGTNTTDPFVLTDGSSALVTTTSGGSRSTNATGGNGYFYLFIHDYYELTAMTLAGFDVALREPIGTTITTTVVTNAQGMTADYKVYRSSNQLPGSLNISITYTQD